MVVWALWTCPNLSCSVSLRVRVSNIHHVSLGPVVFSLNNILLNTRHRYLMLSNMHFVMPFTQSLQTRLQPAKHKGATYLAGHRPQCN